MMWQSYEPPAGKVVLLLLFPFHGYGCLLLHALPHLSANRAFDLQRGFRCHAVDYRPAKSPDLALLPGLHDGAFRLSEQNETALSPAVFSVAKSPIDPCE